MKQLLIGALLLGMSLALLYNLCLIFLHGQVLIQEPNTILLFIEIGFMALLVTIGLAQIEESIKK